MGLGGMEAKGQSFINCGGSSGILLLIGNDFVDDVTKRVYEFALGCLTELYKQKEYIGLLEAYIEELENDDMDNRRSGAVRSRITKTDQGITGSGSEAPDGSNDSDGGDTGSSTPAN